MHILIIFHLDLSNLTLHSLDVMNTTKAWPSTSWVHCNYEYLTNPMWSQQTNSIWSQQTSKTLFKMPLTQQNFFYKQNVFWLYFEVLHTFNTNTWKCIVIVIKCKWYVPLTTYQSIRLNPTARCIQSLLLPIFQNWFKQQILIQLTSFF